MVDLEAGLMQASQALSGIEADAEVIAFALVDEFTDGRAYMVAWENGERSGTHLALIGYSGAVTLSLARYTRTRERAISLFAERMVSYARS